LYPLITLSESIQLPTYLLIISLIYCFSLLWLVRRAKALKLNPNHALDLALAIMVGGLIGARGMHVFYENPNYFLDHPAEIIKVWNGGFVFYGGAIFAFLAALGVIYLKKINFFIWADVFAPLAPVGYAFGRLGCFFNGCCYGQVCELPWAVNFPHLDGARHPTQLYAFFMEIALFLLILLVQKKRSQMQSPLTTWLKPQGQLFFLWLSGHSINRIIMEAYRDDFRGESIFTLSISTWISLSLFIISLSFLYCRRNKNA
jgi:phosphatidylglycerol:prolipoprotein diacylglycerol transferase